jgi:hypothetical protein
VELIMADDDAQREDQARREYIRSTFGDDALEGLATDLPVTSRRPATSQVLARDSLAARRERQRADDLELVQVAAREQDDDQALDIALRRFQHGNLDRIRPETLAKAGRALKRRGYHHGSTAERLARMAGQGEGWRSA